MAERPDKRVLHYLFRVLAVSKNSKGHAKDAALVPSDQSFEGSPVPAQNTIDKNQIVLARKSFVRSFGFPHRQTMRPVMGVKRFKESAGFWPETSNGFEPFL